MRCKYCGGYITAPVVLTARVRLKDKKTPIKKYIKLNKLSGGSFSDWVMEEAYTQTLDLLECEDCGAEVKE